MTHRKKIRVLLLDRSDDFHASNILWCLRQSGAFDVHCITADPAHRLRYSFRCKIRHERMDTPEAILDAVRRYHQDHPIDVVIPIQVAMVRMAGLMADELNAFTRLAPVPTTDMCDATCDKWRMHQMVSSTGIPAPRSLLSDCDCNTLEQELSKWGSAFLTKPLRLSGGVGIRKYNTLEGLMDALPAGAGREPVVIQEYISGRDVGCSFISQDGEIAAHTIQHTGLHQFKSYTSGLGLDFVQDETVSAIAKKFAQASRWSGVANMDLRVDERTGGVYLLEVNPRYWQTLLGSLAMGINFPELHCRLALGLPVDVAPARQGKWVSLRALLVNPPNMKRLFTNREYSLRLITGRYALQDPLVETMYCYDGIRRYLAEKFRTN